MIKLLEFGIVVCAVLASPATWSNESQRCGPPMLLDQTLARVSCEERGTGWIEQYRDVAPHSPYATEFDRRNVIVARSDDPVFFVEAAGVRGVGRMQSLTQTRLVTPPAVDQLRRRQVTRAVGRHAGWTVYTEHLVYKAQGGARGFVIDCATGLRSGGKNTTGVAECFAVDERPRFLRMLEAID